MFKNILITLVLVSCACFADSGKEVTQKKLEETIDSGIQILKQKLSYEDTLKAFDPLIEKSFHTELMGKLTLGKDNWGKFNTKQREEFVTGFKRLLKHTYLNKISYQDFTEIKTVYKDNVAVGRTKRTISTEMAADASKVDVDYKFYGRSDDWKIYDVEISGISLIQTFRAQFNDYLLTHSPDELNKWLAESDFSPEKKETKAEAETEKQ